MVIGDKVIDKKTGQEVWLIGKIHMDKYQDYVIWVEIEYFKAGRWVIAKRKIEDIEPIP